MTEPFARVRIVKRWNNNTIGDVIALPLSAARNLVAQRYAEALPPPEGAVVEGETSPPSPQRQPGQVVRK
jgi:hypothetical protein